MREHVLNNFVKDGGQYYRQRVGIPQGSVLSSLLCCLLYAHVEQQCLAPLALPKLRFPLDGVERTTRDNDDNDDVNVSNNDNDNDNDSNSYDERYIGLLLRVIDDFLYVTTSAHAAQRFACAMMNGFEEFGCTANRDKVSSLSSLSFSLLCGA